MRHCRSWAQRPWTTASPVRVDSCSGRGRVHCNSCVRGRLSNALYALSGWSAKSRGSVCARSPRRCELSSPCAGSACGCLEGWGCGGGERICSARLLPCAAAARGRAWREIVRITWRCFTQRRHATLHPASPKYVRLRLYLKSTLGTRVAAVLQRARRIHARSMNMLWNRLPRVLAASPQAVTLRANADRACARGA